MTDNSITQAELIEALATNPRASLYYWLSSVEEQIKSPDDIPQFHIDEFKNMTSLQYPLYACAIPRDHAKSTIAKLVVVHSFLFSDIRFALYVSNTATVAISAVQDIIGYLRSPQFYELFGHIEPIIDRAGEGYIKFRIPAINKTCVLKANGAGMQLRGMLIDNQRPELIIADDIEDIENTATEALRLKIRTWFYRTLRKAVDRNNYKIIHIGNMVHSDCLLKKHIDSPQWASTLYGCILSDGKPLWEAQFPLEKLKQELQEFRDLGMEHAWYAEMMNTIVDFGNELITTKEIEFKQATNDYEYGFITIDPAISASANADKSAIVVHVFNSDEQWQIVDYVYKRGLNPQELFRETIELARKWNVYVIGIESVAYQEALQTMFKWFMADAGMPSSVYDIIPLRTGGVRKSIRIQAWVSLLKNKTYCLTYGDYDIVNELANYDVTKKEQADDLIDACAYGAQMIEYYCHVIHRQRNDSKLIDMKPTTMNDLLGVTEYE